MASAPLLGGIILGTAASSSLLLHGRVLGISGAVKGLVLGNWQGWRVAFVLGLLLPVTFLAQLFPAAVGTLPSTLSVGRTLISGLLVGLGAAIGNGCTSGHGICGNARLSPRSLAFTATFMLTGALAVRFSNSAAALGIATPPAPLSALTPTEIATGVTLLAVCGGILMVAALAGKALKNGPQTATWVKQAAHLTTTTVVAAVFSTGLMISGMTNPAKVVAFLSFGTPYWDPSLMLVMAGAVAVSMLPYQWVLGHFHKIPSAPVHPILADAYSLPSNATPIDVKLLIGAALFGVGWGLAGMCPGPALITAVAPSAGTTVWSFIIAMIAGMMAEPTVSKMISKATVGPHPAKQQ